LASNLSTFQICVVRTLCQVQYYRIICQLRSVSSRRQLAAFCGVGSAAAAFLWQLPPGMDKTEARAFVEKCLPRFAVAGLPEIRAKDIEDVQARSVASLWAGMGNVYSFAIKRSGGAPVNIMAKKIQMPARCTSIGDQRKKDSYDVEAAFYSRGHAEKLIAAGCSVPFPLHVQTSPMVICMTALDGKSRGARGANEAFLSFLARMHATYWGKRADEAVAQGLQAQGCYWHLDTRPDEHKRMDASGWEGRLKLAARAIDLRLKADPMQSVCHGDAKGANIMYTTNESGEPTPLVYDFQYCGKATVTKDLAYFFNVDVCPSQKEEERLLQHYHQELSRLLEAQGDTPPTFAALSTSLELALCDWRRFTEIGLGGWGDSSANSRVEAVLVKLDQGRSLGSEEAYCEAMKREFPV